MIVAVGTDLVDLARLQAVLDRRGPRFLERILTDDERAYCEGQSLPLLSIGVRFAAKEAVMKCLRTGWGEGVGWRDIEVTRAPSGAPHIELAGDARATAEKLGIETVHVSLSHTRDHALAMAVAES